MQLNRPSTTNEPQAKKAKCPPGVDLTKPTDLTKLTDRTKQNASGKIVDSVSEDEGAKDGRRWEVTKLVGELDPKLDTLAKEWPDDPGHRAFALSLVGPMKNVRSPKKLVTLRFKILGLISDSIDD